VIYHTGARGSEKPNDDDERDDAFFRRGRPDPTRLEPHTPVHAPGLGITDANDDARAFDDVQRGDDDDDDDDDDDEECAKDAFGGGFSRDDDDDDEDDAEVFE